MIAASPVPRVAYLWEPFSVLHRPGILGTAFPYWFPYICQENQDAYIQPIRDMLAFRYGAGAELRIARSAKDAGRLLRDWWRFAVWRARDARPLLKDPIAVFSSEWLADTFDADVVVMIRHPAAFVNSVKRRELHHPFGHFLHQPLLMRDLLHPYAEEIERFAAAEQPLMDQGILLWTLVHHAIARFQEVRPGWTFLRLEDVARDPVVQFEKLYGALDLTFDADVRRDVLEHSDPSNPVEVLDMASRRRDSRASVVAWKTQLSPEEIGSIRQATA
ncbi:MAG: hypothetical protein ABI595_15335, partial [Actinomycetota bacterium]